MKTLVIGGARSGKSAVAARWAGERSRDVCCIVTALAADPEMAARIAQHQRDRPPTWSVVESPLHLADALDSASRFPQLLLIDCLTVWSANCLWPPTKPFDEQPDLEGWRRHRDHFLQQLHDCRRDVILVSNDVGSGIIPDTVAGRLFRDEHGWLNQKTAALCDNVWLVIAGLPQRLSPPTSP